MLFVYYIFILHKKPIQVAQIGIIVINHATFYFSQKGIVRTQKAQILDVILFYIYSPNPASISDSSLSSCTPVLFRRKNKKDDH